MKKNLTLAFIFIASFSFAQYKNDNVLFKTLDLQELPLLLKQNPGYLILDVRTRGEHLDTSSIGQNIGRLKGAYNIDIRELPARWNEIAEYKDRPVFVYCSHSQRSRRASKMLADSGFTKVFNINGGLTALHYRNLKTDTALKNLWLTANNYKIISAQQLCDLLRRSDTKLIDVRSDSLFSHLTDNAKLNAFGQFRKSKHIPLNDLTAGMNSFNRSDRIIFVDANGGEASRAAKMFADSGFTDVSFLEEGIDRWLLTDGIQPACKAEYISPVKYKIITAAELGRMKGSHVVLDIRSSEEYNNMHKETFRNIGALNNAVNIPFDDLDEFSDQLRTYKKMQVIVYDFGGGKNAYAAAEMLSENGFQNVYVLAGGLFNLRWTAANVKGQKHLSKLVTGIPEENL